MIFKSMEVDGEIILKMSYLWSGYQKWLFLIDCLFLMLVDFKLENIILWKAACKKTYDL